MARCFRGLAALQRLGVRVQLLVSTWWLTTISNSCFMRSVALFWPAWVLATYGHPYQQNIHTQKKQQQQQNKLVCRPNAFAIQTAAIFSSVEISKLPYFIWKSEIYLTSWYLIFQILSQNYKIRTIWYGDSYTSIHTYVYMYICMHVCVQADSRHKPSHLRPIGFHKRLINEKEYYFLQKC